MASEEADPAKTVLPGRIYRHWKLGDHYLVISANLMRSDGILSVLYAPLYDCPYEYFERPIAEWFDEVEPGVTRFTLVDMAPAEAMLFSEVAAFRSGLRVLDETANPLLHGMVTK